MIIVILLIAGCEQRDAGITQATHQLTQATFHKISTKELPIPSAKVVNNNPSALSNLDLLLEKNYPAKKSSPSTTVDTSKFPDIKFAIRKDDGTFCHHGSDKYILRGKWTNIGEKPIRTIYISATVYSEFGEVIYKTADYPIYSVANSEFGIQPGQTYSSRFDEGLVIKISERHSNVKLNAYRTIVKATEQGIK